MDWWLCQDPQGFQSIPWKCGNLYSGKMQILFRCNIHPEAYNSIADIEDRLDVKIHHWPSAVQNTDYAEAAALVSELDLIITVNTSIHHLAGALEKNAGH